MAEIWKPVPSLPGVLASDEGRVVLPPSYVPLPCGGYRAYTPKPTHGVTVAAAKGASCKFKRIRAWRYGNIRIHRAVCEAFHGPAPTPAHVVMHLNEDGTDNRPANLKWGTRKENQNAPGFKAWAAKTCRAKMAGKSGMRKQ